MTKNGMDSLTCDWVVRAESIYTGKITVAVEIIRDDDKSDKEIIARLMRKIGLSQNRSRSTFCSLCEMRDCV